LNSRSYQVHEFASRWRATGFASAFWNPRATGFASALLRQSVVLLLVGAGPFAASVSADLVGHWSLNGTLENESQPLPDAAYFLLTKMPQLRPTILPRMFPGLSHWAAPALLPFRDRATPRGTVASTAIF
jgi:hypothetical protein